MLKKKYRLPAKTKLNHPSSYKSESFRLTIARNNLAFNRFGFIISKKIDKRSVIRNRTKRCLRSCVEEISKKIINGYDMLFILQKKSVNQKRDAVCSQVAELLKNIKLIK